MDVQYIGYMVSWIQYNNEYSMNNKLMLKQILEA